MGAALVEVDGALVDGGVGGGRFDRAQQTAGGLLDDLYGAPAPPRMSVRSAARSRRVQCQPEVRRRSSFAASSCGSSSGTAGPKRAMSGSVRGSSAAAAHRWGPGRRGCPGPARSTPRAAGTAPRGGAPGRCPTGRPGRPGRPGALPRPVSAARLLPEGGPGARVAADDDGVEAGDVDAEFEGGGGGQAEELAGVQGPLQGAPLLREVAAAVGGDPLRQERSTSARRSLAMTEISSAPRRERTKATERTPGRSGR